jgi:nucleolar protein 53
MADTEPAAPAQYKQPSRKGKKAWRKNVDVTQIQTGLDDVRDQIIQGYASHGPRVLCNC